MRPPIKANAVMMFDNIVGRLGFMVTMNVRGRYDIANMGLADTHQLLDNVVSSRGVPMTLFWTSVRGA